MNRGQNIISYILFNELTNILLTKKLPQFQWNIPKWTVNCINSSCKLSSAPSSRQRILYSQPVAGFHFRSSQHEATQQQPQQHVGHQANEVQVQQLYFSKVQPCHLVHIFVPHSSSPFGRTSGACPTLAVRISRPGLLLLLCEPKLHELDSGQ